MAASNQNSFMVQWLLEDHGLFIIVFEAYIWWYLTHRWCSIHVYWMICNYCDIFAFMTPTLDLNLLVNRSDVMFLYAPSMVSTFNQHLLKQWMQFNSWEILNTYCCLLYLGDLISLLSWEVCVCTSQDPLKHSGHFPQMKATILPTYLCSILFQGPASLIVFTSGETSWFLQPSQISCYSNSS